MYKKHLTNNSNLIATFTIRGRLFKLSNGTDLFQNTNLQYETRLQKILNLNVSNYCKVLRGKK